MDAAPLTVTFDFTPDQVEVIARRVADIVTARTPAPAASKYLTVPEAADLLRSKPQRVYDLVSATVLTRHKDGARVLLLRAEVEAYLGGSLRGDLRPPRSAG